MVGARIRAGGSRKATVAALPDLKALPMTTATLAELTAVTPAGDGHYRASAGPESEIPGGLVNGGFLLAVAARALAAETGVPHPVTITGHFLTAVRPGDLAIDVELLRHGRHATARALVRNDAGQVVLAATGTFRDLTQVDGVTRKLVDLHPLPSRERTVSWPPGPDDAAAMAPEQQPPSIFGRFLHEVVPDGFGWAQGEPGGEPVIEAWAKPAVGSWDPIDLIVLTDVYPPPVFNIGLPIGWVPTLELTVQLRALPATEWVASRFATTEVTRGYVEEDGVIRGEDGALLAISRQLALVPRRRG